RQSERRASRLRRWRQQRDSPSSSRMERGDDLRRRRNLPYVQQTPWPPGDLNETLWISRAWAGCDSHPVCVLQAWPARHRENVDLQSSTGADMMPTPFIAPNWHVILIHFPLGLFTLGMVMEIILGVLGHRGSARTAARWLVVLGALSSLPAAYAGLYAMSD